MLSRTLQACGCWFALLAAGGCAQMIERGRSPLLRPTMSPDSVALEVFFVRFPFADDEINGALWNEIDEQRCDAATRRNLAENGFRVGIVPTQIPQKLQELLQLTSQAVPAPQDPIPVAAEESQVSRRVLQVRSAQRSLIQCSGIYDSLPLLRREGGDLAGKTYPRAQGLFTMRSYPQGDGRVRLDLLPELHYGDTRQQWVGDQGVLRLEAGQSKKIFDELAASVTIAPGEMLILTSLSSRIGSLGHHFFTQPKNDSLEQKLLLVRLSQTQQNDLFGPDLLEPPEK